MSDPREVRTADGRRLSPVQVAAHDGIRRRLTYPSMHWGVEGVHSDAWPHIAAAAADAIVAAGWTLPVEGEQPGCTGAGDCPATAHTHGCYADTEGHCEYPEEHGWTPPGARVKPSVEDAARAIADHTDGAHRTAAHAVLALLPGRAEAEVKVEALRDAAQDARLCWTGTTNLRAQDDPEVAYSFDAWLDARANNIARGGA